MKCTRVNLSREGLAGESVNCVVFWRSPPSSTVLTGLKGQAPENCLVSLSAGLARMATLISTQVLWLAYVHSRVSFIWCRPAHPDRALHLLLSLELLHQVIEGLVLRLLPQRLHLPSSGPRSSPSDPNAPGEARTYTSVDGRNNKRRASLLTRAAHARCSPKSERTQGVSKRAICAIEGCGTSGERDRP